MEEMWPEMNKTSAFYVTAEEYGNNAEAVEEDILNILDDYKNLRLQTLREKKIDDAAQTKALNTQVYGLTIFIIIFSIFNMINTSISSITARRREFAMLESIGMERRQIVKMLCIENIYLAVPNLIITLTAGGTGRFWHCVGTEKICGCRVYALSISFGGIRDLCPVHAVCTNADHIYLSEIAEQRFPGNKDQLTPR